MTDLTERTNTHVIFFHAKRTIVDEKISRNVSRRLISDNNGLAASATNTLLAEEIRGQHRLIITMRTAEMYCITHRRNVPDLHGKS